MNPKTLTTDPHKLAAEGLCQYTGDASPLGYDGTWYNPKDWVSDGYADAVRVTVMLDSPAGCRHLVLAKLTVNRPKPDGLRQALASCGYVPSRAITWEEARAVEIEACLGYGCYDPNDSDWREPHSVGFVIPDDEDADLEDFASYARIHGAKVIQSEDEVWQLLHEWVAVNSCA